MSGTPLNPRWERIGAPLKYDVVMFERLNIRIPEDMMRNLNVPVLGEANDRDTILSVDPQTLKVLARKSKSKTLDNLVNGDRPTVDPVLPDPVE